MDQNRELLELKKRLVQFDEVIKMTQNLNSEMQKKNENMEIENRTLEEEYHTLKDNYENLKKRFEQLQKELTDVKTSISSKSSIFGWIINNGVKDENSKLKEKVLALEHELNLKIQENEQIHIEIFEEKQKFNRHITELESEIEKMKFNVSDKMSELNSVNEKNSNLMTLQRTLEANLTNIAENLKKTENEFNTKLSIWKNKKVNLKTEIEAKNKIQKNLININDYSNTSLNVYNFEYINNQNFTHDYLNPSFKLFTNFISNFSNIISQSDNFIELLIERFNYIKTNIELKIEHKGYLYACDKLRFHSFTLQQILRTTNLFTKLTMKKIENLDKEEKFDSGIIMNITLLINIVLTLLNKTSIYIELLSKYYKIFMKEERKISYNEVLDSSIKLKINKDLKNSLNIMSGSLNLVLKKVNLLSNFNLEYNIKNIQIISDNTSGILIKVSKKYFKDYKHNCNIKISQKYALLENIVKIDVQRLKKTFYDFMKIFSLKSEIEYKIYEVIKEENKNKYNYPIINLSAFKSNNENIKKSLSLLCEVMLKLNNLMLLENTNNNQLLNLLGINSWEYSGRIFIPHLIIYQKIEKMKFYSKELIKSYSSHEAGVDYEEAVRNKTMLKEMLEKENLLSRDRENYMNKINEYEEDLKRYREQYNDEKNLNDLLKMEMLNKKDNSINSFTTTTSTISNTNANTDKTLNSTSVSTGEDNEFEYLLKNNKYNIADIQYEVLSDDVQSGKQRSTFKLSNPQLDNAIPLTKFTAQIENNQDVSVMYHRRIIEKLQRYASKVKNVDFKVLSNLHLDEIKSDYENRIDECNKKYDKEVKYLTMQIEQKDNNIHGYTETINFLNSELEVRDKNGKEIFEEEINMLKLQLEQKDNNIHGYTQTIEFLNTSVNEYEELRGSIKDCSKCKKFIKN